MKAVLASALFFLLAPVTVAGLVPWWISRWRFERSAIEWRAAQALGALLIAVGAVVLLDSFARFALQGLGTPSPVFPARHLVVTGPYRYVRNPMYVAVLAVIAGQGLLFVNLRVLAYAMFIWLSFHVFVLAYEEPFLTSTFGAEYRRFCAGVPRWIPRLRPWRD